MKQNMKQAYIAALEKLIAKRKAASKDEAYEAYLRDESVVEDELQELTSLDFSWTYNAGTKVEDVFGAPQQKRYQQFITDWELPEPTGTPPKQPINLSAIVAEERAV